MQQSHTKPNWRRNRCALRFNKVTKTKRYLVPLSRRLALHLSYVSVDRNVDCDIRQRPRTKHCRTVVRVIQTKVDSLWAQFPVTAQLKWRPQWFAVPRSNLYQYTSLSVGLVNPSNVLHPFCYQEKLFSARSNGNSLCMPKTNTIKTFQLKLTASSLEISSSAR